MDYSAQRQQMVEQQLRARGIGHERVLAAIGRVQREWFVPPELRERAYADSAVAIGAEQTISQPFIVGLTTQALDVAEGHRVLEIGTGSGYQTAVLAELGAEVFTIERITTLSLRARSVLDTMGYQRIHFRIGDGTLGWPEEAPFDRIVVTAMAPELPAPVFSQLRTGGKMVIPIGTLERQSLQLIAKVAGKPVVEHLCGCLFVKLIGEQGWADSAEDRRDIE
ncbi:MAG: protein-L-isoaspartate(D-aspartate) O-methyltransferase [Planctomycetes bacterium]|nr:protein-L-isoaspartate(D-aspartate) O-methyltransferase [Planctomycetota bacterium]